ncbi:uncharacterized protein LOC132641346 [Lycium barbarum]|uniref:uncharacterized protein LOC132641346 n=1 Tax=Lycium barbarum TaxID=112863 RepID=UPI00293E651C|nr:uncharacterized protein LOC132641346 [Lycium barbarum]XP_060214277.1 uncharacterized protein LOC132641346 [Lycium barbarum]XP_060214278.1 uncharacterized protein LOC132641346 [Lycium barbarum]XP_060214279.1 uncharacterized protein LOC132641346 [Lycium barbarum]XP_060214280.1 uncharacterized protein LOC132641346 [Lycium barbarum]XP_060214281.1 uncharacterized protein LOC132641346 [Lycium barbarum]XP_060214282.1 uncharacterized protein LOC132641346 [Lycium barbarum]XP_060214283.1 uncharacte
MITLSPKQILISLKVVNIRLYAWGKKCFEEILKTTRDKQCAFLTMYKLGGFPLALQTWFFECCSTVDKKLVVRVGNNVPCILNWKVTDSPTYTFLADDVPMPSIDKMKYCNISPTTEEKINLKIAAFFEDINADHVSSRGLPVFQNKDSNISPPPHPQNMEQPKQPHLQNKKQQPVLRRDPSGSSDGLTVEVAQLKSDISELTGKVEALNTYIVSSFGIIFKHLKIKQLSDQGNADEDGTSDQGNDGFDSFPPLPSLTSA